MGAIWFFADGWLGRRPPGLMPQLEDVVRHGFKVSRFPDFWPCWETGILPKGPWHVPGIPLGVEFGFLVSFFLHIHKKNYTEARSEPVWRLCRVLISVCIWHLIGDQDHSLVS